MHPRRYKPGTVRMRLPGVQYRLGCITLMTVPGYWGIAASDRGDIWSCRSGQWRKLKGNPTNGNCPRRYLTVSLRVQGEPRRLAVNRLVATAWHGEPEESYYEADHYPDHDPANNRPDNLCWRHPDEHIARHAKDNQMTEDDWEDVLAV